MSAFELDPGVWITEPTLTRRERLIEARNARDITRAVEEDEQNDERRQRREEEELRAAETAQAEADEDQFEAGRQAGMNFRI